MRLLSEVLLAMAGILLPIALCLNWLAFVALDSDRFARTVTPVAENAELRVQLADALFAGIARSLTIASADHATVQSLVAQAGGIDAVLGQLRPLIDGALASPRFVAIWTEANRLANVELKRLLRGESLIPGVTDESLTITFTRIETTLNLDPNSQIGQIFVALPAEAAPYIDVLNQPVDIPAADFLVSNAGVIAIGVTLCTLLLLVLGLWLSLDRRRALIFAGIFGLVSLGVAVAIRQVSNVVLGDLDGVEGALAEEYADTLTASLVSGLVLVAAVGGIVAVIAIVWPKFQSTPLPETSPS